MTRGGNQARVLAHKVLVRVVREGAYADRALDAALGRARLSTRDRALSTELVYGTLRHIGAIDFLLAQLSNRPLRKIAPPVIAALRLGVYQLLHTRVPARAAVHESVELVRRDHRHATGFANAVLRKVAALKERDELPEPSRVLGDPMEALAASTSHPVWVLEEVAAQRGEEEMRAWAAANNERPRVSLRVRTGEDRDEIAETLSATTPELFPDGLLLDGGNPAELAGFAAGRFTVQDLAAQLVGRLAAPVPGSFVLDACAAPGGKAVHLAELMQDRGHVLAVDIHPAKTRLIQRASKRLGLTSVEVAAGDASDPDVLSDLLYERSRENVDLAVIDAPCSGMGTLRRNPELRRRPAASVAELTRLQDALLDAVTTVLAPAGVLVYAVCTVTRAEGPERVAAFLGRHGDLELDEGVTDQVLEPFVESCNQVSPGARVIRTWTDRHGCDSFFMARMRRTGDA